MTPEMARSTSQAAPVWEPKNRDSPVLALGRVLDPDGDEGGERHEHGHREEVLDEPDDLRPPDDGDVEVAVEQGAEGFDDRQEQDR